MEADAAHRIELLDVARELEKRLAEAEAAYRRSVLKTQQSMTKRLHKQADATDKTMTEQARCPRPSPASLCRSWRNGHPTGSPCPPRPRPP